MKPYETHPLLEKRQFPWRPWIFRVTIMVFSLSALGYAKFKLFQKNQAEKRPSVVVPASRSRTRWTHLLWLGANPTPSHWDHL